MNYQGMNIPYGLKDSMSKGVEVESTKDSCNTTATAFQTPAMSMSCGCGCPTATPTYQNCNQVVNKCYVQDVPHYINYNTHVVNNCVKRHYTVPTYTQTQETVYSEEYVNQPPVGTPIMGAQPMQQPVMGNNGFAPGFGAGMVAPLIF